MAQGMGTSTVGLRRADARFVEELARYAVGKEQIDDDVLTQAGLAAYGIKMGNMTDEAAEKVCLRRAKRAMRNPDVRARYQEIFAIVHDENDPPFTVAEAVRLAKAHMRGTLKKEQATATGEIIEVKIPPSLPALAKYLDVVVGTPERRSVGNLKVTAEMVSGASPGRVSPGMAPRVLSGGEKTPTFDGATGELIAPSQGEEDETGT